MRKEKLIAYGYVGRYFGGSLGWHMPRHLGKSYTRKRPSQPAEINYYKRVFAELCKITIEPVKNAKGKPIRRRFK